MKTATVSHIDGTIKKERGAILILVTLLLLAFVAIVALISDIGYQMIASRALQNAADSAALAASRSLNGKANAVTNAMSVAIETLRIAQAPGSNSGSSDLSPPPDSDARPYVYIAEDVTRNLKVSIYVGALWRRPPTAVFMNAPWFQQFTLLDPTAVTGQISNVHLINSVRVELERKAINTFLARVIGYRQTGAHVRSMASVDIQHTTCAAPFAIPLCHVQSILSSPEKCWRDVFFVRTQGLYPVGYANFMTPAWNSFNPPSPPLQSIVGTMALTGRGPPHAQEGNFQEVEQLFVNKLACVQTFLGDVVRPIDPYQGWPFFLNGLSQQHLANLINGTEPNDAGYRHVNFSDVFGTAPNYCVGYDAQGYFDYPPPGKWPQAYPIPSDPPITDPPVYCPLYGHNVDFCHTSGVPWEVVPNGKVLKTNFMVVAPENPNLTYCNGGGPGVVSVPMDAASRPQVVGFLSGYIMDFKMGPGCQGVRGRLSCDPDDLVPSPALERTPTSGPESRVQPVLVYDLPLPPP